MNSNFIQKVLLPGILGTIYLYSGQVTNFSKILTENLNKRRILSNWFKEIHLETSISNLNNKEILIIWNIHQTRINNRPNKFILDKAFGIGLDKYIFYSKCFEYSEKIKELVDGEFEFQGYDNRDIKILKKHLANFLMVNKVRKGDVVKLMGNNSHKNNLLLYNGTDLEGLYNIDIKNYPLVDYFRFSVPSTNFVSFDTTGIELKLIREYTNGSKSNIFEYCALDYIIWSYDNNLSKNCSIHSKFEFSPILFSMDIEKLNNSLKNLIMQNPNKLILYDDFYTSEFCNISNMYDIFGENYPIPEETYQRMMSRAINKFHSQK